MLNCTTESYDVLYARWLEHPGDLLDWADYQPWMSVLDLAGGTGAIAREALRQGNEGGVTLIDLNPRCSDPRVRCLKGDLNDPASWKQLAPTYDLIICRQALGYLNLTILAREVEPRLSSRVGKLVFNTFRKPKWSFRPYSYNGRWFVEASAYFGKTVYHLQMMSGDFDVTKFRWYSHDDILNALDGYLVVTKSKIGTKSMRYQWKRRYLPSPQRLR